MAKNYKVALKIDERNNIASEAEEAGDVNKAIRFYEQNIREDHGAVRKMQNQQHFFHRCVFLIAE